MGNKAKHLVSQLLAARERLSSLTSGDQEPPHQRIAASGIEVELAFDALLSAKFSETDDYLFRIRHLISYIKQSSEFDGIRENAIDQVLEDTLALVEARAAKGEQTTPTSHQLKHQSGEMVELCYRSKTSLPLSEFDIRTLTADAATRNKKNNITGMLAYDQRNERIFQILEGRQDVIQNLMSSIVMDNRHHDIEMRFQGRISERSFGQWWMFVTTTSEMKKEIKSVVQIDDWVQAKTSNDPQSHGSFGRTWMTDTLKEMY